MVSSTRQTERRRAIAHSNMGRNKKRARAKASTPTFPLHPEGYDTNAPDAKKPTTTPSK
jgi:hypothetical protein